MANLKIQNLDNNYSDKINPIKVFVEGKIINILTDDRIFFESSIQSNFPSENSFTKQAVLINFENGTINSNAFTNVIPQDNNFRLAQVFYTRNKTIEIVYSTTDFSTKTEIVEGFENNTYQICGRKIYGAARLLSVILSSTDGVLNNIQEQDLFVDSSTGFKFLNSVDNIFTETDIVHYETLIADVFDGEGSVKVKKTICEIGDLIKAQKLSNGVQEEFPVGSGTDDFLVVTDIVKGLLFDEVLFTPTLIGDFTVGEASRIIKLNVRDFKSSFISYSENQPFDTGWISVSAGDTGSFAHQENKSFSGHPIIYFSPTGADSDVMLVHHGYASGNTQTGVWVYPDTGGMGTFSYDIGLNGVFFDFETNTLITSGFIRFVLSRA